VENMVDTTWDDDEIALTEMSADTKFVFDRMTEATLDAVDSKATEEIIDLACGRAVDAFRLSLNGSTVYGLEPSSIMIEKALAWPKPPARTPVILVRGIAEYLPFPDHSFDKLVCKGAMDHFASLDKTFAEIARVLRPEGKLIISVANFSSLSCKLGKALDSLRKGTGARARKEKPFWDPPDDHNFVFNLPFLKDALKDRFKIRSIFGVSLLWGLPGWGRFLDRVPEKWASFILRALDQIARGWVSQSDVIVAVCEPRNQAD
jgi:SAM-dependent methyltransferase